MGFREARPGRQPDKVTAVGRNNQEQCLDVISSVVISDKVAVCRPSASLGSDLL